MKSENAIEVRGVSKSFKVYYDKGSQLKERLLFWNRNKYERRQVLDNVSFEVKKGEAIGLIGHNGCGKSTTLKLLTRIIYPDSGQIEMRGRVSSLIELGAGFHPDMSGRENIYTNAAIFGLKKKEIDARLNDIIAFSELGEYIDNPVRTYSSGMYMRLAFSVAINVDADILLIDEILAVGDAGFQTKCFNKMKEIKKSGTTIILVSHSMGQVEQLCDRSIWIHNGKIMRDGNPKDVDVEYLDYMGEERRKIVEKEHLGKTNVTENGVRWGNGNARMTKVAMLNSNGAEAIAFKTNEQMTIEVKYDLEQIVENAVIGISISRSDGVLCYGTHTRIDGLEEFNLTESGCFRIKIYDLALLPGAYDVDIAITTDASIPVDYYKNALKFEVVPDAKIETGVCRLEHKWEFE